MIKRDLWTNLVMPPVENDVWELFHENSKVEQHRQWLDRDPGADRRIRALARSFYESLPYDGYPKIDLPSHLPSLSVNLGDAILKRGSALSLIPVSLKIETLTTLLRYSYGVTRPNKGVAFPIQFRAVPSAGALYPLEIYFHSTHIEGLEPRLFHYQPIENAVRLLVKGDHTDTLAHAMAQTELARNASLIVFLAGVFERSVMKYGERGYRFTLLEAGHVAQNFCLISAALGLGCVTIGGFLDRIVDDFIGIDGLTHSTIYAIAVGERNDNSLLHIDLSEDYGDGYKSCTKDTD